MHGENRFNPSKLEKLNHPGRLTDMPPELILKEIGLSDIRSIVDIGAGTGLFSKAFADLIPDVRIYACDISPVMTKWMVDHILPDYPCIETLIAPAGSVPLDDDIADIVLMINLHHEIDEPIQAVREAKRLLRPGGRLAVVDWKKEDTGMGPSLEIRISAEGIADQFRTAGFSDVTINNGMKRHSLVVGTA